MILFYVIVSRSSRRFPNSLPGPKPVCPEQSQGTISPYSPNPFPLISFADPHPLTPLLSYRFKNRGRGASSFSSSLLLSCHPEPLREGSAFSFPRCFLASLTFTSERLFHVLKTTYREPMPIPERPQPTLQHAD